MKMKMKDKRKTKSTICKLDNSLLSDIILFGNLYNFHILSLNNLTNLLPMSLL